MELKELERLVYGIVEEIGLYCKKYGWTVGQAAGCKSWKGIDGELRRCKNCKHWKFLQK